MPRKDWWWTIPPGAGGAFCCFLLSCGIENGWLIKTQTKNVGEKVLLYILEASTFKNGLEDSLRRRRLFSSNPDSTLKLDTVF